jgi:hypothetical protein
MRELINCFSREIAKDGGMKEFLKLVNAIKEFYGIEFNADEIGSCHVKPSRNQWTHASANFPAGAAIASLAHDTPRRRAAPLQLTRGRDEMT